jgi:CRP/FNR family cyclic AMP-dependent transcriptional regulator
VNLVDHFRNARNTVSLPSGRVLFREGDPGRLMYVLLEGTASVLVGTAPVELASPGALLGEMALIDRSPRSATALARSACRFLSMDRRQFDLLVRETPAFGRHVMKVMAARLRRMNDRMEQAYNTKLSASA